MAVVDPDFNLAPSYQLIQQALQQRANIAAQEGALSPLSTINAIAEPIAKQQQTAAANAFELRKQREKAMLDMATTQSKAKPTVTVTQEGIDEFMEAYGLSKEDNPEFAKDLLGKTLTEDELRDEAHRRITALETKRNREENREQRKAEAEVRVEQQKERQAALEEERTIRHDEKLRQDVLNYSNKLESNVVVKTTKAQGLNMAAMDQLVQAAAEGNTIAMASLGIKAARAMGEVGVITDQDVKRYITSAAMARGITDKLKLAAVGKPTDWTLEEIKAMAPMMKDVFEREVQKEYNTYVRRLAVNYGMDTNEAATRLDVTYTGNPIRKLRNKKTGEIETIEFSKDGKAIRKIKLGDQS